MKHLKDSRSHKIIPDLIVSNLAVLNLFQTLLLLQIPLPITLCCFHRLLVTFRALWQLEVGKYPIVIPARTFYDGSVNYYNIDRLGGVLSHLNKTLKVDLMRVLGPDHSIMTNIESSASQPQNMGKSHIQI